MGKSAWDTGQIMGVSERTVKFHLENARAKLKAMNTTHAVSKAISLNLITLY
jgi:LuxR family transcriptional regulator